MTRARDIANVISDANLSGTLDATGVVTANAGVKVDNITIDGTEIDLSSGDLTIDVAGDLTLDVGGGDIILKDDGTEFGNIANSSSDLQFVSIVNDKNIIFRGNDGGSFINALTLDMSDGGTAQFNSGVQTTQINTGSSTGTLTLFGGATNKGGTIELSGGNNTGSDGSGIILKTGASTSSPSERMRIDSSGLVGIGTSSPSSFNGGANNLVVGTGSGSEGITIFAANDSNSAIFFADGDSTTTGQLNYQHASNVMTFHTNGGTERARITTNGLHVNSTRDVARICVDSNIASFAILSLKNDTNNTGSFFVSLLNHSGSGIGGISQASETTVAFNTASDYRLKENVNYNFDATTELKKLKPCKFNFIGESKTIEGFLAHEVSDVVPLAINGVKDGTRDIGTIKDADGNILQEDVPEIIKQDGQTWTKTGTEVVYQSIDHSKIVPLLVKTIQELEARITALEGA